MLDYTYIKYSPTLFSLLDNVRDYRRSCDVCTFYRVIIITLVRIISFYTVSSQYYNTVQTFYGTVDIVM